MPDAIVDIWKDGIYYWGYSKVSTFAVDNVVIEHK